MDKTRGYQASIDYLMPIVTHPVMTGEYCRHLRNSIDAMIKFERIQSELERLNAENTKLKKALWWAVGQINDEELLDKHICGYHVRPDTGYCEWCENYGKAFELSGWEKDEEGER